MRLPESENERRVLALYNSLNVEQERRARRKANLYVGPAIPIQDIEKKIKSFEVQMKNYRKEYPADDIPSPSDFFLGTSLYQTFRFDWMNYKEVAAIEYFNSHLDCYCNGCEKLSIFTPIYHGAMSEDFAEIAKARDFQVHFQCNRNNHHTLSFFCRVFDLTLRKIGQEPSLADLSLHKFGPSYKKLLGNFSGELTRAIGLHAHGVGIGAFVYLRRIFEMLIEEAHAAAKSSDSWDERKYADARMNDKIVLLKDFLPEFLLKTAKIYGILSKGIHELSEQECLSHFIPIKNGIEIILDEKIETAQKHKKESETRAAIAQIAGKLR